MTATTFLEREAEIRALLEETDRGAAFERLAKLFLERDPAGDFVNLWLWKDWPGRFQHGFIGVDDGAADLVGEERDGSLTSIQAKFVSDPTTTTRWKDLGTWAAHADAGRPFRRGLLITNAIGISHTVRRNAFDRPSMSLALRDAFVDSTIDWREVGLVAPTKRVADSDQEKAIADVIAGFTGGAARQRLIAACGTGKSLMAFWAAQELRAQRVLVLLPSLALIRQFHAEWGQELRAHGLSPRTFAICSEGDDAILGQEDMTHISVAELGIRRVSTDPGTISGWLASHQPVVVYSTYQSSPKLAEAMALRGHVQPFDLVVADEAHHIVTDKNSAFAVVLDATRIRANRRLFMTATEKILTARAKSQAERMGADIASMDDEAKFGPLAHRITFAQAIESRHITDYRIVIAEMAEDDSQVREMLGLIRERRFVTADGLPFPEETDASTVATALAVIRAADEHGFSRVISFHTKAEKGAAPFAELVNLLGAGRWKTAFVNGEQPTAQRELILQDTFDSLVPGRFGLVSNARCLGEGVNLPDLEAIAFADPRSSVIDIVQAAGRAMRLPKSIAKSIGYIVIPVVIPAGADPALSLSNSAYERVFEVVAALRSHDERLADVIDSLRAGKGPRSVADRTWIENHVIGLTRVDPKLWQERIVTRIVDETYDWWAAGMMRIKAYVEREHRLPPLPSSEAQWVTNRRTEWGKGRLPVHRKAELDALWPGWELDQVEAKYRRDFTALTAYVGREGRLPPQGSPEGRWLGSRRQEARRQELSAERKAELDAVWPGWHEDQNQAKYRRGFTDFVAYIRMEGRLPPKDRIEGQWLVDRRQEWSKCRLSAERKVELDAVWPGWEQDQRHAQYRRSFMAVVEFVGREGRLPPRDTYEGRWLASRRSQLRAGRLSAEREADLDRSCPGWRVGGRAAVQRTV